MEKNKAKNIAEAVFGVFYTFIFFLVFLITMVSIGGMLLKKPPVLFGYSVSVVLSSTDVAGLSKGDNAVARQIKNINEINEGDIIAFYANANDNSPIVGAEKRKAREDAVVIFREVAHIDARGELVTRNADGVFDSVAVPFGSVVGLHEKTSDTRVFLIKLFLADNGFLYWVIGFLALTVVKQIFNIDSGVVRKKLRVQVIKGERELLDKECLESDIFPEFSRQSAQKIIVSAPYGMSMLYEYLLFGKVTRLSNTSVARRVEGRNYGTADVLSLTYSGEIYSKTSVDKCVGDFSPRKKKNPDKYRNSVTLANAFSNQKCAAIPMVLGCIIFAAMFVFNAAITKYPIVIAWYEVGTVACATALSLGYLIKSMLRSRKERLAFEKHFAKIKQMPKRYHFLLRPDEYNHEKINGNIEEMEFLLYRGKDAVRGDIAEESFHEDLLKNTVNLK